MSECMTQEDAMNMSNEQAVAILRPMMNMMRDQYGCPISDAYFALDKAITALLQPQRMKGRWISYETENDRYDDMRCPFCKKSYTVDAYRIDDIGFTAEDFNFCPNCGTDMRGDEDAAD